MTAPEPKAVLFDAQNIMRRAYEAAPGEDRTAVERISDSAVHTVLRVLRDLAPSHALCVFEGRGATWRHARYRAYKANRPATPEAVNAVAAHMRESLRGRGLATVLVPRVEADDVIATVAHRLAERAVSVVVVSTDRGFSQLLGERIAIYEPFAREQRTARWAERRFGVPAAAYRDLIALTGNSTDNIPGVPGIGPKKAAALLEKFGNLDAVLAAAPGIPGKLGEAVRAHADTVRLGYELATLDTGVAVGGNLRTMRLPPDLAAA